MGAKVSTASPKKQGNGVTFQVTAGKVMAHRSRTEKVQNVLKENILYKNKAAGEILQTSSGEVYLTENQNGLVEMIIDAHDSNKNLILRPDDFWIAILAQFSLYVNANAEKLRDKFVSHDGKEKLYVNRQGDIHSLDYAGIAQEFTGLMQDKIKDDSVRNWLIPNFTTSEENDITAASIMMMSSMQKYFDFGIVLQGALVGSNKLGIVNVTLLGTLADWMDLQNRVDMLKKYDNDEGCMEKWTAMLLPIMAELIEAYQGRPDLEFWRNPFQGDDHITGWLTSFCAFTDEGVFIWDAKIKYPMVNTESLITGIVNVPVTIYDNGVEVKCQMFAGQLGYISPDGGKTYRTRSDWAMALVDEDKIAKANVNPFAGLFPPPPTQAPSQP